MVFVVTGGMWRRISWDWVRGYRTDPAATTEPDHRSGMKNLATPPKPSKITVPHGANPVVKILFSEMRRQCVTYEELSWRSGVTKAAIKAWRVHNAPGLDSISAALGALPQPWEFLPVPPPEAMSAGLRREIARIAAEFGADDDAVLPQLVREFASRTLNVVGQTRGRPSSQRNAANDHEPAEAAA